MNLPRSFAAALVAAGTALTLGTGVAHAATAPSLRHDVLSGTSSNWAGYAVSDSGTGTTPTSFTSVSGSWVQPTATCTAGSPGHSAFWVGLGGFADGSRALEQIGTEADCSAGGTPSTSVWYELVPAPAVDVSLTVQPGDLINASVTVSGTSVTLTIADATNGASFTKTLTVASPDTSSAEWIAESPSTCGGFRGGCRPLPLANFGTVSFTGASTTGSGHVGAIGDPAWGATAITLSGSSQSRFPGDRFGIAAALSAATPGQLSSDGTSFSVTWQQVAPSVSTGSGFPAAGRGWGRRPHSWGR